MNMLPAKVGVHAVVHCGSDFFFHSATIISNIINFTTIQKNGLVCLVVLVCSYSSILGKDVNYDLCTPPVIDGSEDYKICIHI